MQINLYWTFNLHIQFTYPKINGSLLLILELLFVQFWEADKNKMRDERRCYLKIFFVALYRYCKLRIFINKTFIKCYFCKYYYNICLFLNNLVAIMLKYSVPDNKIRRLNKLEFFDLLNRGKDPHFDVFAETACLIADCPSSLIATMESETQTIQSCIGLEIDSMNRENTVCQYSIANGEVVINETLLDNRSPPDPLILAGGIRLYARIPFVDNESFELGTICLNDYKHRAITESQITTLKKFKILTEKSITMDMLNEQIGGDDYFKEIFLNLLINELNQTKNDIDTAAAIKNTGDAKMILHKLKGTVGTAGLFSLSECALKWEKKADDNMDFSAMKKEIIEEITIGLNIIKSLIKYNQKLC